MNNLYKMSLFCLIGLTSITSCKNYDQNKNVLLFDKALITINDDKTTTSRINYEFNYGIKKIDLDCNLKWGEDKYDGFFPFPDINNIFNISLNEEEQYIDITCYDKFYHTAYLDIFDVSNENNLLETISIDCKQDNLEYLYYKNSQNNNILNSNDKINIDTYINEEVGSINPVYEKTPTITDIYLTNNNNKIEYIHELIDINELHIENDFSNLNHKITFLNKTYGPKIFDENFIKRFKTDYENLKINDLFEFNNKNIIFHTNKIKILFNYQVIDCSDLENQYTIKTLNIDELIINRIKKFLGNPFFKLVIDTHYDENLYPQAKDLHAIYEFEDINI